MMKRFVVMLEGNEAAALWRLGRQEKRDPRQQAALLIRGALEQAGLLPRPGQPPNGGSGATSTGGDG